MLPTMPSARDEITGLFWSKWQSDAPAVNGGSVPEVRWDGVDEDKDYPPNTENWARCVVKHRDSRQAAFTESQKKRYERGGFVTVQVFASLSTSTALQVAESLALIARDAFEGVGTASGIWFRRVRVREVGPEPGGWYQMNVVAEFEYDEVK